MTRPDDSGPADGPVSSLAHGDFPALTREFWRKSEKGRVRVSLRFQAGDVARAELTTELTVFKFWITKRGPREGTSYWQIFLFLLLYK